MGTCPFDKSLDRATHTPFAGKKGPSTASRPYFCLGGVLRAVSPFIRLKTRMQRLFVYYEEQTTTTMLTALAVLPQMTFLIQIPEDHIRCFTHAHADFA